MCTYHTTYFCGVCGACQRERLARWRQQLAAATTLARSNEGARRATALSQPYSAAAASPNAR
jgi:hypothetical protein